MPDQLTDFGERLPYLFRRINGVLSQRLDEELSDYHLTQAQLSALAQLDTAGEDALSGAELSARAGITPQSMSKAISGLLDRGLVVRRPNPDHGRKLDVRITAAGLTVLRQVQADTLASGHRFDLGLDDADTATLRSLLQRAAQNLDIYLPASDGASPLHG